MPETHWQRAARLCRAARRDVLLTLVLSVALAALPMSSAWAQVRFEFEDSNPFGDSAPPAADTKPSDKRGGPSGLTLDSLLNRMLRAPATTEAEDINAAALNGARHAGMRIDWRLENPFRFFTDPADTELHRQTFLDLTPAERRGPILAVERTLGRTFRAGWAAELKGQVCWNQSRNLHRCPDGRDYMNPDAHVVLARLASDTAEPVIEPGVRCQWRVRSNARDAERRTRRVVTACDEPARLAIPYPEGATVSVSIAGRDIATRDIEVEDLLIVGIGDSFGSGEGNPDVPVRFD
ncbi:MAG: hypothetical protein AAGG99_06110, partial [Pseudomonadota bacterium]